MKCIDQVVTDRYALYHGDSAEVLMGLPANSWDYSIFSPPFSSLYTYSNSPRDMGNCKTDEEFFAHFDFMIKALKHVMKPGRNVSFHCMDLPTSKERDGYIGIRDFSAMLISAFEKHGFIMHTPRVTIWKDPVSAMQRTKALGLLHKTVRENATMSRTGIPDYLVTMRAPGEIPRDDRVTHGAEYPVELWQKIASPVWMDIDPSDTLQYRSAREHDDERHIAPLQLEVIRRGIMLWTNPGEIVGSPYGGIGSEPFVALELGRKAVACELKTSYYKQMVANISGQVDQLDIFGGIA